MAIPPDVRAKAETELAEFCSKHSSAPGADRLRYTYEIDANGAFLLEQRPGFVNPDDWQTRPIAKFRYSQARNNWSLYWSDTNQRWHRVSNVKAEQEIATLLQVVVTDPLGVFWS